MSNPRNMSREELENDNNVRIAGLELTVGNISNQMASVVTQLSMLGDKVSLIGRPNYATVIGVVGLMITLIGAGYFIINLSIKTELAPIAAAAEISIRDRAELHGSVSRNSEAISKLNSDATSLQEKIVEQETQQRSNGQIRNMQVAYEHAFITILWRDMKGSELPPIPYFPDIALPKPQAVK